MVSQKINCSGETNFFFVIIWCLFVYLTRPAWIAICQSLARSVSSLLPLWLQDRSKMLWCRLQHASSVKIYFHVNMWGCDQRQISFLWHLDQWQLDIFVKIVPNPKDPRSSSEHKLRYFWWNLWAFWPSIDSNATDTFKARKVVRTLLK